MHQPNHQYNFYIKSGNYTKGIIRAIEAELSDDVPWKQQLIWTVQRFNFNDVYYSQITLIVQEYAAQMTFRTPDNGVAFILTVPELATDAPSKPKNRLRLFFGF